MLGARSRVGLRRPCSARCSRANVRQVQRGARSDDSSDELLRLQQELMAQIEARKARQAEGEGDSITVAAASSTRSSAASLTVDLDEEYRKTLAKFKKSSEPAPLPSRPAPSPPKPSTPAAPPKPVTGAGPQPATPRPAAPQQANSTPQGSSASTRSTYVPSALRAAAAGTPPPAPSKPRRARADRPVVVPGKPTLPPSMSERKPVSTVNAAPTLAPASAPAPPPTPQPVQRAAPVAPPAPSRPAPAPTPSPPPQRAPPPPPPRPTPVPEPVVSAAPQPPAPAPPPPQEAPPPPPEKPLAGDNVMNIIFVGAECAPWSKTGGLGDVMGSLPKAMQRRGHRVMVVSPRYEMYEDAIDTSVRQQYRVFNQDVEVGYFHTYKDGVDYVFVDHNCYHNRKGAEIYHGDRLDQAFRNCLLCKAALEAVWHVPCGGYNYGDENTVFIANDWHTAVLPVYLQAHYRDHGKMTYARSVLTIHNMAYQGRAPFDELDNFEIPDHYRSNFFLDDPVGGEHMNILKAGIITASRVVAVSAGYAWEIKTPEGGWGLHEVLQEQSWKLCGIANGIDYDEWHPSNDKYLRSDGYENFSLENLKEGKAKNKAALQRELGLPVNPDVPLLGFIGRMDHQKGIDLIEESYHWLMGEGVQLIMLGSGRADLEESLRKMERERQDQCRGWVGFSVPMAHRITAGCDMLLMPSRFEPCGLNQLYAMKYGTVPIVHAVGGLRETVQQFNPFEDTGTGWQFDRAEANAFRDSVGNALYTYREHRDSFSRIGERGAARELSWDAAAAAYEGVLVDAKFQW